MANDNTPAEEQTLGDKVNNVVEQMQKDESGNWQVPEGVDEYLGYAAMTERRRRDTQAAYTKTQQEHARLEAENRKLAEAWAKDNTLSLPPEERLRLEELKHQDPEAWREEMNQLEIKRQEQFNAKRKEVSDTAVKETELERRNRLLDEHNAANPDVVLTDDIIENDIPPRYVRDLESGAITFDDFLAKCSKFLSSTKVIASGPAAPSGPDLSNLPGSSEPSDDALSGHSSTTYNQEIY